MTHSFGDEHNSTKLVIESATKAVKSAGTLLADRFIQLGEVEGKGAHDVVTATDREAEQIILELLKAQFPAANYVAEESGRFDTGDEHTWYIDPLDGTSNFVTGNPYFSVSVALAHRGQVILGVVHNPITAELYTAVRGQGSFATHGDGVAHRLSITKRVELEDSIVATAYAADEQSITEGIDRVRAFALVTRKTVINFSPALDLCNVARGRLDALVDAGTTPEDHAAGSLIVTEAGGVVRNFGAQSFDVEVTGIVAASSDLSQEFSRFEEAAGYGKAE